MTISSSAMLVDLNLSVWTANKLDKDASSKVTSDNNASVDAGYFRKNLMAGTTKRKAIADFAAMCRTWHNNKTMPWADRGSRLLPTALFMDYKQQMDERRQKFNEMVDEFVAEYPQHVQMASTYLGNMFNPDDYPTAEEVRGKFGFNLVISPVPESGDFRLDVPNEAMADLAKEYDTAYADRIAQAMREPWNKLHEMLTKMVDKLDDNAEGGPAKRWGEGFITNAQEMCSMLTALNITKDPELEQARRKLEQAVSGVYVEDLKEDGYARADVKAKLDNILKEYEW